MLRLLGLERGYERTVRDLPSPWINGYLCAGQAPPTRRLASTRMTNNKHRHFSLSNGVFTDKKFTRLPPFCPGTWSLYFLLSTTGSSPTLACETHPLATWSNNNDDDDDGAARRRRRRRRGPTTTTTTARPDVPFSREYLHADTFGPFLGVSSRVARWRCAWSTETDRYIVEGDGFFLPRFARLHDF